MISENQGKVNFLKRQMLKLKNAYGNQATMSNGLKEDWIVYDSEKNEFGRLPKEITDPQYFAIMELVKKAEEDGFALGIKAVETQFEANYNVLLKEHKDKIELLLSENERLSNALDKEMQF